MKYIMKRLKYIRFKYIILYKLLDEAKLDLGRKHIFRIKYEDIGFKGFIRNFKTERNFDYILEYKDNTWILINN